MKDERETNEKGEGAEKRSRTRESQRRRENLTGESKINSFILVTNAALNVSVGGGIVGITNKVSFSISLLSINGNILLQMSASLPPSLLFLLIILC